MAEKLYDLPLPEFLVERLQKYAEHLSPALTLQWQDAAALILIRGLDEFGPKEDTPKTDAAEETEE
jgi:hypothetical protein